MKWSELRKIVEKHGWILHRHGSNHDVYRLPGTEKQVSIGRHGKEEVRTGTFNQIKKLVGF